MLIITGATASGKSSYALRLAHSLGAEIINCDAIQQYHDLPLLTARPSLAQQEGVPHHLYATADAFEHASAVAWARQARRVVDAVLSRGNWAIMVGGSGMYVEVFLRGIAPVPAVPISVQDEVSQQFANAGDAEIAAQLHRINPRDAAQFSDRQRMLRAIAVNRVSGQGLTQWWSRPRQGGYDKPWRGMVLWRERDELRARCAARFQSMLAAGALKQLADLLQRSGVAAARLPRAGVFRALGAPQLAEFMAGRCPRDAAVSNAITATRRYAKRQQTWFRNRLAADEWDFVNL